MFCAVLPGLYNPVPPDHCTPEATEMAAFTLASALLPHSVWSRPAFTVGAGVMPYVTDEDTGLQRPLPAEVSVRVTVPAAISAADGT